MITEIHALPALRDNYIYLLVDKDKGECAAIDPGEHAPVEAVISQRKLCLTILLCTHHHHDHIDGVPKLMQKHKCQLWTSRRDQSRIPGVTRTLEEGRDFDLLGENLKILEVPGHTQGQVAFYFPRLEALFVGDTLFSGGCGRLFEGTAEQMFHSLAKIKALPPSTQIFFGHEYTERNLQFVEEKLKFSAAAPSTGDLRDYQRKCQQRLAAVGKTTPTLLADEIKVNPFLRAQTPEEFRHWRLERDTW